MAKRPTVKELREAEQARDQAASQAVGYAVRLAVLEAAARQVVTEHEEDTASLRETRREVLASLLDRAAQEDAVQAVARLIVAAFHHERAARTANGVWDAEQALWAALAALPAWMRPAEVQTEQAAPPPPASRRSGQIVQVGQSISPEALQAHTKNARATGEVGAPISLMAGADGTYTVMDGNLRLDAARELGMERVAGQILSLAGGTPVPCWIVLHKEGDRVELRDEA